MIVTWTPILILAGMLILSSVITCWGCHKAEVKRKQKIYSQFFNKATYIVSNDDRPRIEFIGDKYNDYKSDS